VQRNIGIEVSFRRRVRMLNLELTGRQEYKLPTKES